jgi:YD repeat-containing protein
MGRITTTVYDPAGNVTEIIDPLGRITTTVYDPDGQVTETIDPRAGSPPRCTTRTVR